MADMGKTACMTYINLRLFKTASNEKPINFEVVKVLLDTTCCGKLFQSWINPNTKTIFAHDDIK